MNELWEQRWIDGHTIWDVGIQPAIAHLPLHGRVLDIGCGTGAHTYMAAGRGHETVGIDISPTAIRHATEKPYRADRPRPEFYVQDIRTLHQQDMLGYQHDLFGYFDTLLDVGCYHCMTSPDDQARYQRSVRHVTRPGALLHLLCFAWVDGETWGAPPLRLRPTDLETGFRDGWEVVEIVPTVTELDLGARPIAALQATLRRSE